MSFQEPPEVSIVIPARNEEARLPSTLQDLSSWMDQSGYRFEVLVVVEPGEDRTPEVVREAAERDSRILGVLNPVSRGKGYAVRTGMEQARGTKAHFFMDADFSVPPRFIGHFLNVLLAENGPDAAIGSRHLPASRIAIPQPLSRRLAGRMFNLAVRLSGIAPFQDTQCGFKAFRPAAARKLFPLLRTDGFAFDVELLWVAKQLGLSVVEEPVEWNNRVGSSVRLWLHGPKALRDVGRMLIRPLTKDQQE